MSDSESDTSHTTDTISPKKSARAQIEDDASTHLPHFRTDRERPSPGPNRKKPGSGAAWYKAPGPDGIPTSPNIFLSGPSAPGAKTFAPGELRNTPPCFPPAKFRSQSTSPTPSRRAQLDLDTGYHATDVESELEEGQIPEYPHKAATADANTTVSTSTPVVPLSAPTANDAPVANAAAPTVNTSTPAVPISAPTANDAPPANTAAPTANTNATATDAVIDVDAPPAADTIIDVNAPNNVASEAAPPANETVIDVDAQAGEVAMSMDGNEGEHAAMSVDGDAADDELEYIGAPAPPAPAAQNAQVHQWMLL
ncbi:hypothetical protein B0H16DRAFT_1462712 [Mycena metata]|uniref:Uncharacterized protein n=1 Tax=Mycena metata TaxID=1033252 RepID=A0AAD7N5V6_9AGAR|nr:hypothetical protein B0H16DRAFT_1462712 [Mycena metata]